MRLRPWTALVIIFFMFFLTGVTLVNLTAKSISDVTIPPAESAKIDINQASQQAWDALPGIGPVLAGRIVELRKSGSAFRSIDDLLAVKGIGHKKLSRLRKYLSVEQ
ncbi:helix-hairpin-helix domain-containing protein [bacterium]|nr:helix-hairpin-helix domain-containing protein [bacterium]